MNKLKKDIPQKKEKKNLPVKEQPKKKQPKKDFPLQDYYSKIYEKYDLVNRVFTFGQDVKWRRKAVQECLQNRPAKFLDICTGTGDLVIDVARSAGREIEMHGYDFSAEMLRKAREKATQIENGISAGEVSTEGTGKGAAEGSGKGATEGSGKGAAESTGKVVAESTGKVIAESTGKVIAESAGKVVAESAGKDTTDSTGRGATKNTGEGAGKRDRIEFTEGNVADMPYADGSFDSAGIAFGIRNLVYENSNADRHLAEIRRVLRPYGRLVILESSKPDNRIWRFFNNVYLQLILPYLGGMISGNLKAYRYLARSSKNYYSRKEMSAILEKAGFLTIRSKGLFLGSVMLIVAEKQGI